MAPRPRLAVFCSGSGSNLQALIDAVERRDLAVELAVVVGNNRDAFALQRARQHAIPWLHISQKTHADVDQVLVQAMVDHRVDAIALAGYMKRIESGLLQRFPERIFNIHPALLPRFGGPGMYGQRVHEAVLAAGVAVSGATVHLVDGHYDHGRILDKLEVPVVPDDSPQSLAERVLAAEHQLYWRVLQRELVTHPSC